MMGTAIQDAPGATSNLELILTVAVMGIFAAWVFVLFASRAGAEAEISDASSAGEAGLVLLTDFVPGLRADIHLSTSDNPFKRRFYRGHTPYLRAGTAQKVRAVQEELEGKEMGLRVWSAYRPFVVQEAMFEAVGGNADWISDPYRSSGKKTHVRGVALDCTITDGSGTEVAMPTPYLDFENGAERMKHGFDDLSEEVLENRRLLKETMKAHGMEAYRGEWWHYQDSDWENYALIEPEDFPEIHRVLLIDELLVRVGLGAGTD